MKDIDSLIEVISKGYYPHNSEKYMKNEIMNYFTCRLETYKLENNEKISKDYALVDTVTYFSKQMGEEWKIN